MINLVACRPAIDSLVRCRLVPGNSSRNNFPFPRPSSCKGSSFLASYVLQSDHVSLLSDFHGYFWDSNESPNALPGQYSFVHVARFLSIEIPLGIAWDCPALTYIIIKKMGIESESCGVLKDDLKRVCVCSSMRSIDLGVARKLCTLSKIVWRFTGLFNFFTGLVECELWSSGGIIRSIIVTLCRSFQFNSSKLLFNECDEFLISNEWSTCKFEFLYWWLNDDS